MTTNFMIAQVDSWSYYFNLYFGEILTCNISEAEADNLFNSLKLSQELEQHSALSK